MKKVIALLLTGLMVFSLTACGNTASDNSGDMASNEGTAQEDAEASAPEAADSESEDNTAGDAADGEVVEITVQSWQYALGNYKGFSEDSELTQAIADEFNATHPGIHATVTIMRQEDHYNALRVDFAAESAPDVIGIAPGADLEQYKSQLEPLAVLTAPDVAWGVNASSANKEAAWEFVKWLCYDMQQEVVDGLGFFSVLKDAPSPTVELTADYQAAYDVISAAAASEHTIGFRSSFYTELNDALFDQLQLLGTGAATPEEASAAMEEAAAGIAK